MIEVTGIERNDVQRRIGLTNRELYRAVKSEIFKKYPSMNYFDGINTDGVCYVYRYSDSVTQYSLSKELTRESIEVEREIDAFLNQLALYLEI